VDANGERWKVPPAVRRLDVRGLVDGVAERAGVRLEVLGATSGGQVGAAYVRWPDGRQGVLTVGSGDLKLTVEVLALARLRGIPVPAYELIVELPDGVAIVQQRLPGERPERADLRLVQAMVEINERFAGLLADRPDVPVPDLHLRTSGPGFCLHESLRAHSVRSQRLLDWILEVGREEPSVMAGDDLVHLDFHPDNLLVDATGGISGIVDWDGIGRGDRRFALVTLRYALIDAEPAVTRWLDDRIDRVLDEDLLRLYQAHMSLRMVDWAIRHFGAAELERWLDFAEEISLSWG
jgi:aminoglycoside phosphotransferase (APT) family kinase protein